MDDKDLLKETEAKVDIWHNSVPVEKSAYVNQNDIIVYNEENFKLDPDKPTMIDLFSGAGGFSVGCEWAGFQSVLGTDWFEPALNTWKYNHPNAIAVLGDIRNIEPTMLVETLKRVGVEKINLITGGVPCQGFSRSNRKHNDDDERNYLFQDYMKMVEAFKPDYIIVENVSGMKETAGGKFVNEILNSMEELDYSATVKLLNAAEYGVPQIRKRLIFVGIKRGRGLPDEFIYPKPEYVEKDSEYSLMDLLEVRYFRTVEDAISDLPQIESGEVADRYINDGLTDYQKILKGLSGELYNKQTTELYNHIAPKHPDGTIEKIKNTEPGMPMYEKFKQRIRLRWDRPSPTQLAGGIRPQFQFGHPSIARGLTIRERARIQSFPDSYKFLGGTVQERVQTGNAVPPLLVYAVAKEIAKGLENRPK